jgi:hypothetical protein
VATGEAAGAPVIRFDLDRVAAGRHRSGPAHAPELFVDDHPAFLPLGVCFHAAERCYAGPLVPGWGMWCVLSRLYDLSDRSRIGAYRDFWRALAASGPNNPQSPYIRSSHARSEWHGLLYSVGLQPHVSIMALMYGISSNISGWFEAPTLRHRAR